MSLSKKRINHSLVLSFCHLGLAGFFIFPFLTLISCSAPSEKEVPPSIVSTSAPPTSQATTEGGWESSGGGGIACFKDEQTAKKAQSEMDTAGFLRPELRSQIQSAMTLDSWEYFHDSSNSGASVHWRLTSLADFVRATQFFPEHSLQKQDAKIVFKKSLKSLSRFLPLLTQKMEMVSKHIPLSSWKGSKQVPVIHDADLARPLAKNCVRIQIANRLSRSSQNDRLPDVEISYDEEIFNKFLSEFDKALLFSHENLYVLGRESNHTDSNLIRRFNAFLFSEQSFYPGQMLIPFSYQVMLMREIANYPFGDYMRFFKRDETLTTDTKSGTQASRYQSMIVLMEFLRKNMSACLANENYQDLKISKEQWGLRFKCQKRSIEENPSLLKKLNPEQAFVFLGRFFFDRVSDDFNSEHLMTWSENSEEKLRPELEKQVHYYCRNVDKVSKSKFAELQSKAQQYCKEELGISPEAPNQPPFRRNFSCFSKTHLLIWHDRVDSEDKSLTIALNIDPNTGQIYSLPFKGVRTLVHSKVLGVEKDLGFGNQKISTNDTYKLVPINEDDQQLLRGLVDRESSAFFSAEVLANGKSTLVKNFEEYRKVFADGETKAKILNMNVILECIVTNTNLPESDWYIQ